MYLQKKAVGLIFRSFDRMMLFPKVRRREGHRVGFEWRVTHTIVTKETGV